MKNRERADIVNSATPLETQYVGVHPRLYATNARIAAIRERLASAPWDGFLRRVETVAQRAIETGVPASGDVRGVGCGLAHLAIAYRLTEKPDYVATARDHLVRMAARNDWTCSLQYGHWAHGMAVAYDWLHAHLDDSLRETVRETLRDRTERVYNHWANYVDAYSTSYAWNHMTVVHGGLMAAGCAIWGEVEGAGRWLRMGLEKMRLKADALGSDGASAEGLAYGQYHLDFFLKSLVLTDELLGVDLFEDSVFLRRYPLFMLYSMLAPSAWEPGPPDKPYMSKAFVCLADSEGAHWYGPDSHLRLIARRYRDGHAQWLADLAAAGRINGESSSYFNLLFHDESVVPEPPFTLPTLRHFDDKDIVMLRSGWDERASVMAVKCGPSSGYHARRRYRQNISGGHMHPDAGHVVLHACGEWLLIDDGYTRKATSYQNTVLVSGIGQTGEGADWFEDLEIRRGRPEGRIIQAQPGETIDWVIADAAAAYKPEARLRRFFRHVLYLKPDVWILIDELESEIPSTFELRFHVPRAFTPAGEAVWLMRTDRTALQVQVLGPTPVAARAFRDRVQGIGARSEREIEALAAASAGPESSALFVTVLHAHPVNGCPRISAHLTRTDQAYGLNVQSAERSVRLRILAGQPDPRLTIQGVM